MKKVLFATTALIATASVAAADVRISGYGRFGLDYNSSGVIPGAAGNATGATNNSFHGPGWGNSSTATDANFNGVDKTTITSRLRLQFDMSAETDSGVAFGARVRMQAQSRDNNPGASTRIISAPRFFATYEGFSVGVGNIIGAIENMPGTYLETRTAGTGIDGAGFVSHVGNVNNEYFNWDAYSSTGSGNNGVEALYSAGGFVGHLSYSARNVAGANSGTGYYGLPAGETRLARTAISLSYRFGDWRVSAGFQDSTSRWEDKGMIAVSGNIGQFGVRAAYADNDGISKWGLYGNMDIGAASNILLWVTDEGGVDAADVAAGRNENRDGVAGTNAQEGTSYGIHYSYDLGGGASFETGYRRASNDNNTFQAGVYFSF